MIIYLLKSSACTALFYVLYLALFRSTNWFQLNRAYLLTALLASFIIPMIVLPETSVDIASIIIKDNYTAFDTVHSDYSPASNNAGYSFVSYAYYLGAVISLLITVISIFKTLRIYWSTEKIVRDNQSIVINPGIQPFSFMGILFIRSHDEDPLIVAHEMVHVRQRHWIDLLLVEIAAVVVWFNPILYFYRRSIAIQHEYIADRQVTSNVPIRTYLDCIARQLESRIHSSLISSFNTRSIKQRIVMITNTKRYSAFRYAMILPVLALIITAFATREQSEVMQNNELRLPVDEARLNKRKGVSFGKKINQATSKETFHKGVDFVLAAGNEVYAAASGVISTATSSDSYGNYIVVAHDRNLATSYAHLEKILVAEGDQVEAGQLIGTVGSTGLSTGPHLHFEVLENGTAVDPALYLKMKIE